MSESELLSVQAELVAALRLAEERLVAIEQFTSQSSHATVAAIRAATAKAQP